MHTHIVEASYLNGYAIRLRFSDGAEGEVDLSGEIHGPVFEPLIDPSYFRRFTVHPELKTLVWPNGADFAPEFLRSVLRIAA